MPLAATRNAIGAIDLLLRDQLVARTSAGTVDIGRVEQAAGSDGPKFNLFLYQVDVDGQLRNYPLDRGQRTPVWLVLRYLLTAFDTGRDSNSSDAHILLGEGMLALEEINFQRPTVAALVDNPEPLKITFDAADVELLSKVMQGSEEHYRVSAAFQVRPVLIAPSEPPSYAPLVHSVGPPADEGVVVIPSLGPVVDAVTPTRFEGGAMLTLSGRDFAGEAQFVCLGDTCFPVVAAPAGAVAGPGAGRRHAFGRQLSGDLRLRPAERPPLFQQCGERRLAAVAGLRRPNPAARRGSQRQPLRRPGAQRHPARWAQRRHLRCLLARRRRCADGGGNRQRGTDRVDRNGTGRTSARTGPLSDHPQSQWRSSRDGAGGRLVMTIVSLSGPAALTPGLRVPDAQAAWWLSQVHIRLRREVGWCWLQRSGHNDPRDGSLPPLSDAGSEALDWVRFQDRKQRFLAEDPTSRYLTACLESLERHDGGGAWAQAAERLALDPAAQFLLALALAQRLDAGLGPVFAACMNDHARPYPTAALAQRLWDDPAEVAVALAGAGALVRNGLIRRAAHTEADWLAPLDMPAGVACALAGLANSGMAAADALPSVTTEPARLTGEGALIAWRLAGRVPQGLEIVPLSGPKGADFAAWAAALNAPGGRPLRHAPTAVALAPAALSELSTIAWLDDADLLLPEGLVDGSRRLDPVLAECQDVPVRWFLPASDRQALTALPAALMLPEVRVPALDYQDRLTLLMHGLGSRGERVRAAAEDCARRFRLEAPAVRRVTDALVTHPALDAQVMTDACRMEAQLHLGPLAQRVVPRFTADELVLPPPQARQFAEIAQAMRSLTRVHHQWGTAKAWNESGLAVLFCGPPGTGKTMAAEALADALAFDLYRIDLAQVVDKYIGETEKNLRRDFRCGGSERLHPVL